MSQGAHKAAASSTVESNRILDIFHNLPGTWHIHRLLQSSNAAEPAGKCIGTATYTAREPTVFVDDHGQLQLATGELLYHEQGEFELEQSSGVEATVARFPFSRKYVWRLQGWSADQPETLSIWFTKLGTDKIDYLFHTINLQSDDLVAKSQVPVAQCIEGDAGHLCEQDFYSSTYSFQLDRVGTDENVCMQTWSVLHEVRGPQKDQLIETRFSRP